MRYKMLVLALVATPALATADGFVPEDAACPAFMRDSTITLADTAGGSQLTITTPHANHVPVMRVALREAAQFVERQSIEMAADEVDRTDARIPVVSIGARDVKAGVVLTIRARRLGDVSQLRRQSRMIEQQWKQSSCIKATLPPRAIST